MSNEPAPEPILYYQGQPTTREQAAATRVALMADPDFAKAALDGDTAKQVQLRDLYMLERGVMPTAAAPMASADDVEIQVLDRAAREQAVHVESVRRMGDFTEQQIHEITNLRPVPLAEKQYHERELAKLQRDKEAVKKYLDGDREMRTRFSLHSIGAKGLPVARSLAEIEEWQKRFPSPVRK